MYLLFKAFGYTLEISRTETVSMSRSAISDTAYFPGRVETNLDENAIPPVCFVCGKKTVDGICPDERLCNSCGVHFACNAAHRFDHCRESAAISECERCGGYASIATQTLKDGRDVSIIKCSSAGVCKACEKPSPCLNSHSCG